MQRSAAGAEMLCIIPLLLLFVCIFPVVVVAVAAAADGMLGQKCLRLFAQLTELVLVSLAFDWCPFVFQFTVFLSLILCSPLYGVGIVWISPNDTNAGSCS